MDKGYYEKRVRQEQNSAMRATDDAVRRIHQELVAMYEEKLAASPSTSAK